MTPELKPDTLTETKPFQLVAGHPALDLINTVDNRISTPHENLRSYDGLLRFTHQSGLLTERQARKLKRLATHPEPPDPETPPQPHPADVLAQAIELREAIATLAFAWLDNSQPDPQTLALLESHFKQAALHRRLKVEGAQLLWSWKGLSRHLASPLWLLAQSANDLLTSGDILRLRLCADDTCRWLFLDTSKNHTRRWCDMKTCGNRSKARRFHSRESARPSQPA